MIIQNDGGTNCRFHMVELVRNNPSNSIPVQGVDIEEGITVELKESGEIQLTATVSPVNASNQSVTWLSGDNSSARVMKL